MHPIRRRGQMDLIRDFIKSFGILDDDVYNTVVSWLTYETFPNSLNETHIALILKCDNLEYMKDLRPISLCNVIYKIMAIKAISFKAYL